MWPPIFEQQHRERQHESDPEAPRHVGDFGTGSAVRRDGRRFERHAADRAGTRMILPEGRSRSRLRVRQAAAPCRDSGRVSIGSQHCRSEIRARHDRRDAVLYADRRSCRRRDPLPGLQSGRCPRSGCVHASWNGSLSRTQTFLHLVIMSRSRAKYDICTIVAVGAAPADAFWATTQRGGRDQNAKLNSA